MDITNPRVLYVKAGLFFGAGCLASAALILEHPTLKVAVLHALAVWCFARTYYFAFYVIEHYADPTFRYAGVWSFIRYAWSRRRADKKSVRPSGGTHAS